MTAAIPAVLPAAWAAMRRSLIAKVKIGQKALGWSDDVYRDVLRVRFNVLSSTALTESQLIGLVEHMKEQGAVFERKPQPKRAGKAKLAPGALASKIRALWLSLYHLAEVEDPAEDAIRKFVERMTACKAEGRPGIPRMEWLDAAAADKAIKALRGWCERVGFRQPTVEQRRLIDGWRAQAGKDPAGAGHAAKVFLIHAQWKALEDAGGLRFGVFANLGTWLRRFGVAAPHFLSEADADRAIEELGRWLRKVKRKGGG